MIVSDIMRHGGLSVHEHTDLPVAADLLVACGLGTLPVADHAGRLVGVVSEGDVLRSALSHGHPGTGAAAGAAGAYRAATGRHVVADVMTRRPVTLLEEQRLSEVARLFVRVPWRVLPVVRAGRLIGVVTRTDVVRVLVGEGAAALPQSR